MLSAPHPTAAHDGRPDHRVALARSGDEVAFGELVREHQQMIHALAYRMTGSAEDAADLAQDTFVKAWQRLGTFRGDSSFGTWVHRIALNLCLNWRQRTERFRQLHAGLEEEARTVSAAADDIASLEAERLRRVNEALQRLSPADRAAVVLTVFEGLNHAQAARQLDCAETTVSWRVWVARRKLRKWLSDLGPDSPENSA
jgi:RNA polymerase sigma-70 factor (ECF subfamily)